MRLERRVKSLEARNGVVNSDLPEIIFINFVDTDESGAAIIVPGFAMFVGHAIPDLPANDGETETAFRHRTEALLASARNGS